jgi:hypothetical protein
MGRILLECQEVTQQIFIAVRKWTSTAPADGVQRADIFVMQSTAKLYQINRFTEISIA